MKHGFSNKFFMGLAALSLIAVGSSLQAQKAAEKEIKYVGSKKCKACHIREYKSWEKTKMANAFDVLKPNERAEAKKLAGLDPAKDYTNDPKCLPCHTVGYKKEGGFVSIDKTPKLAGVGCEMCHGPGGEYTKKGAMDLRNKNFKTSEMVALGLVYPPDKTTCVDQCHNDKSPFYGKGEKYKFDFAKRKTQGVHKVLPLKYKHD
jgi:nitrate reductase cytochrome c-type subunit